jgi:hypothetical protein
MKIHGTAQGGAVSKKDFGVAFSSNGGNGGFDDTGLKAYYKFDAASGAIDNQSESDDSIGTDGDMAITGATYGQTGILDDALSFDGSNDLGNIPTSPLSGVGTNDDFTIVMWIKTSNFAAGGSGAPAIMGTYDGSSAGGAHWQLYENSDEIRFSDGVTTVGWSMTNEEDGNWNMLVLNRSGSSVKYWFNNSDQGALTAGFDLPSPSTYLRIAQRGDGVQFATMETDEFSFWSRSLSESEMTTLYNSGDAQAIY